MLPCAPKRIKEKTCHFEFETENGDIERLEKGENHGKMSSV
jgi:hypothetical protein